MSDHEYTPKSKFGKWFNDRLPLLSLASHLTDYPTPKNLNYWWTFGGILTFCLITQIVTGLTLAMHYIAHADMAFESVEHIMRDVNYGWLIRYIHANGASMFFLAVYIHIFRSLFYGSYKAPREIIWIIGIIIYLLMMAAALENQIYQANDTIDTSPYKIGSRTIQDPRYHGVLSMEEVLIKSSNTGISKIALELDPCNLYTFFNGLGFGQVTSSGFPGEASGTLDYQCSRWREGMIASLSYGYNVDISLTQLAGAYAAIANGGIRKPVTLRKVEGDIKDGERVLSEQTSKEIMSMLEKVAIRGAPRAKINGYRIGGKTGTAQIAAANYASDKHNALFVGFAPLTKPKIAIAVIVNEPGGKEYYGGQVAAPVFSEIGSHTLRLLGIAPDDK